jgi:peptidoglycan/xylan/chitin deacetylase (PgdA/CDA1 family)
MSRTSMPDLTLSFDNGPEPGVTDAVLDTLARHDLRATFFVLGRKLATAHGRKLAERAHAEGHWLGNHTFSHTTPLGRIADLQIVEREIADTQSALGELAHPQRYFRPFGGGGNLDERLLNRAALNVLQRERFTCVLWNAIPRDWTDPDGWVERALAQSAAQPWTLMVLHDLPTGAMRHLDRFLTEAKSQGARFRQDFPPDCVPILDGRIVAPIDHLLSDGPA